MDRKYRDLEREHRRQLDEYKRLAEGKMKAATDQQRQHYESEMEKLKVGLEQRLDQQQQQMAKEYMRLEEELIKARTEADMRTKELEAEVDRIRQKQEAKLVMAAAEARRYLDEAQQALDQVRNMPYEAFYPQKIDTYLRTMQNTADLIKQGLQEAAVAVAISTRSAMERFSLDIQDEQNRWQVEYDTMCILCEEAVHQMDSWREEWKKQAKTPSASAEALDTAISFWSTAWHGEEASYGTEGWFMEKAKKLSSYEKENLRVKQLGTTAYLKEEGAMSIEDLRERTDWIEKEVLDPLCGKKQHSFSAWLACRQRLDWLRRLVSYLEDKKDYAYDPEKAQMQEASPTDRAEEYFQNYNHLILENDENTDDRRGWFQAEFSGAGGIQLEICLLPQQKADKIENVVQYHIYQGRHHITDALLLQETGLAIYRAINDPGMQVCNTNDESQWKQIRSSLDPKLRSWSSHWMRESRNEEMKMKGVEEK